LEAIQGKRTFVDPFMLTTSEMTYPAPAESFLWPRQDTAQSAQLIPVYGDRTLKYVLRVCALLRGQLQEISINKVATTGFHTGRGFSSHQITLKIFVALKQLQYT